ncbi:dynein light chain roadblock-type 2 [Eurytemora carolleeae]|uniref:dynein light chain roadblock-type 2 n=1 Tax=Eurytemora carolleeae TaxID=1294199 RepID=UPI000C756D32|nr:dynein light chain roadblock-type 2 [Eurytemora carolleeae]|eukprot:XP_023323664.1 dynein light chain roadblock-type 2-like [Eurytemora affinis]
MAPRDKNKSRELEETLKRIGQHEGVQGLMVVNMDGVPVKSTLDNDLTVQYTALLTSLTLQAKNMIKNMDPNNELTFIRLRSEKNEILVAPDRDYVLIVVQNGVDEQSNPCFL